LFFGSPFAILSNRGRKLMNKPIVRCRCGHQVLSKEVLRTDLYERRAPGDGSREYVYLKYRCGRCKRIAEAFVPESRWDWSMLEAARNEMSDQERDFS
jgi:DNA-directed RNA polymerase subunit RPC12/RpoP